MLADYRLDYFLGNHHYEERLRSGEGRQAGQVGHAVEASNVAARLQDRHLVGLRAHTPLTSNFEIQWEMIRNDGIWISRLMTLPWTVSE